MCMVPVKTVRLLFKKTNKQKTAKLCILLAIPGAAFKSTGSSQQLIVTCQTKATVWIQKHTLPLLLNRTVLLQRNKVWVPTD